MVDMTIFSFQLLFSQGVMLNNRSSPQSPFGSIRDFRTGGRWFDPFLSPYSFRKLMIVIATGFIPLSPMSIVLEMVMWKSNKWLGKNIVHEKKKKKIPASMDRCTGRRNIT